MSDVGFRRTRDKLEKVQLLKTYVSAGLREKPLLHDLIHENPHQVCVPEKPNKFRLFFHAIILRHKVLRSIY
jgi:hypothetical protein